MINGIYDYARHPQYIGLFLVIIAFLLQWLTLLAVKALPDPDGTYDADLKRFRDRPCLREEGRCQMTVQSEVFKVEAE